jgi:predicted short-subunit dehydrogenase-like oxidoreductase (DUF2520 family)
MLSPRMARSVSIVGAGRLGRTLARGMGRLGWRIGAVVTRSKATSRDAVRAIRSGNPGAQLTREVMDADVILLTAPDDALADLARELARLAGKECRGKVVLHASGALDSTILKPLARCGAFTGSIHPMQTFTTHSQPDLKGVIFTTEGHPRAQRAAREIARALGGTPVSIDCNSKPAYHAAGTLVAGHALALTESATNILMNLGFTRRRAVQALLPLMRQMIISKRTDHEPHGPAHFLVAITRPSKNIAGLCAGIQSNSATRMPHWRDCQLGYWLKILQKL